MDEMECCARSNCRLRRAPSVMQQFPGSEVGGIWRLSQGGMMIDIAPKIFIKSM